MEITKEAEERFWSKVDKSAGPDGCWEWKAGTSQSGYGKFQFKGKSFRAHRFAWILTNGSIPEGLFVCHKCDNKICCNPNHLFTGTAKENIQDAVKKGRMACKERHGSHIHPERVARGERVGGAKLKTEQVLAIRKKYAKGATQRGLAREYGVSHRLIGFIVRGKSWAWLNLNTLKERDF